MAQMKYVNLKERERRDKDNFVYLKDIYATKILRDEKNRDYLLKIVCAALEVDYDKMKEDFEVVDIRLGLSNQHVQSEADIVFENTNGYYNVEVNFSYNNTTENKNLSYVCELVLRQLKRPAKTAYENMKRIIQINLNSFDQFNDGRFIYSSKLKEETSNKVRSEMIKIIDINLYFLANIDYTNIKKYEKDSLERLLYIFVCNDKSVLDEIYVGDLIMEKIKGQLYDLDEHLDNYLFYDQEEYRKEAVYSTGKQEGFIEGKAEGIAEGKAESYLEIIRFMKSKNLSDEEISNMTGLSLEKIKELISKN